MDPGPILLEWGPALWIMLHYLAARTGQSKPVQWPRLNRSDEETRIWSNLITSLRTCLPCARCKVHYNEYIVKHRVNVRDIETWLWTFHNHVRTSNGQALMMTFDEAHALYGSMDKSAYNKARDVFVDHLRRGMFKRMYTRDDMTKCVRAIQELIVELES